jgi:hypothetical protein
MTNRTEKVSLREGIAIYDMVDAEKLSGYFFMEGITPYEIESIPYEDALRCKEIIALQLLRHESVSMLILFLKYH